MNRQSAPPSRVRRLYPSIRVPIVVLSVPLSQLFLTAGIYDTIGAVVLVHAGLALPTTILITASVFLAVPRDVEEAAQVFGCTRIEAFRRVVAPLALPGIAASAVFTFVLSWNAVLAAASPVGPAPMMITSVFVDTGISNSVLAIFASFA